VKAVVTVTAANGSNAMNFTSLEELGQITALFDERGTNYSIDYVTEF
jgi:hypothetical protein